jgi:hypothetical protein
MVMKAPGENGNVGAENMHGIKHEWLSARLSDGAAPMTRLICIDLSSTVLVNAGQRGSRWTMDGSMQSR